MRCQRPHRIRYRLTNSLLSSPRDARPVLDLPGSLTNNPLTIPEESKSPRHPRSMVRALHTRYPETLSVLGG